METLIEDLFQQKLFFIAFGLVFYYVLLWSFARNKKKKLLDARLALCDSKAERALVYDDDQYKFNFSEWIHDQKDEMIVALLSALLLIEFDDVALDVINANLANPVEAGNWIYLCGGVVGDLLYRGLLKMRG